jgi:hypothetical protein
VVKVVSGPGSVVVVTMTCGGKVKVLSCVSILKEVSVTVRKTVSVVTSVWVGPGTLICEVMVRSVVRTMVCGTVVVNVAVKYTSLMLVDVLVIVVPDTAPR